MASGPGTCAALVLLFLAISSLALPSHGSRESGGYRSGVGVIVTEELYNVFLPHRNDPLCPSRNFYNYSAFIQAAEAFPEFGTTGSLSDRKREIAAFFGQTSHEVGGGPSDLPATYEWGYCYIEEINQNDSYCDTTSTDWPCAPGQKYFGRGPIQLSWNFNYGPLGQALGIDSLANPGLVAQDPVLAFKAALWFWMTPRDSKPSAHDVATGTYKPSAADLQANRLPGYGLITNIINGGLECGAARNPGGAANPTQVRRIGYYERYAKYLGVLTGPNLSCALQSSF